MRSQTWIVILGIVAFLAVFFLRTGAWSEERKSPAQDATASQAIACPRGIDLSREYPVDKPEMDEIEALRDDVAVCAVEYGRILLLCNNQSKGGELTATLEVLYRYRCARARLFWAESKWIDCRKEAMAAVSTAKAIIAVSSQDKSEDENQQVTRVDSQAKLTEARLLLAKVNARSQRRTVTTPNANDHLNKRPGPPANSATLKGR